MARTMSRGYGFKLASESLEQAIAAYYGGGFQPSMKAVRSEIKEAREQGLISKSAKPQIFRVRVEVVK